ncbi:MAG: hypothetical protein AAB658_15590 [Chloroflexota bacterium]
MPSRPAVPSKAGIASPTDSCGKGDQQHIAGGATRRLVLFFYQTIK